MHPLKHKPGAAKVMKHRFERIDGYTDDYLIKWYLNIYKQIKKQIQKI